MMRGVLKAIASLVPVGTRLPVIAGPLKGARWYAGSMAGEGGGLSVCVNLSEAKQLKLASELSKGVETCFDIGANAGVYTVLFARNCERVYAFEPVPRNIMWLCRTIDANKLANVTVVPAAVSESLDLQSFEDGGNCALGKLSGTGVRPVVCIGVDQFVRLFASPPAVIKIDVEGAELRVLRGADRTLKQHKPSILLSTHGDSIKKDCLNYLTQIGYSRIEPIDSSDSNAASEFCIRA